MKMRLKIPEGYRIYKKENEIELKKVPDEFKNDGGNYISLIKRKDEYNAVVVKHKIKCPHCGKFSSMYFPENYEDVNNEPIRSGKEVEDWLNSKREVLKNTAVMMSVGKFLDYSDEYHCYKCGKVSSKSDNFCEVIIETTETELTVKRNLKTLGEIAGINWTTGELLIAFPLYEQLIFDFSSGIVRVELVSGNDVVSKDVTNNEVDFEGDLLVSLISKNKILKRMLVKIFEKITKQKVLFDVSELDFHKFVNLTFFQGFPKSFYDAIPFKDGTNILDGSFKKIVYELRTPEQAMDLLKESTLPDCKSIRKIFTEKSGLFFYIKECEMLNDFFEDVNLLCGILKREDVYQFLVKIHYYNIKSFLEDFKTVATKKMLVGISKKINTMTFYALEYCTLSDYAKKREQEKWFLSEKERGDDRSYKESFVEPELSMPMHPVPQNAGVTVLGRYTFKWLRTKSDYTKASENLENCLGTWSASSSPVVVVFSGEIMVAAIEIEKDKVVQALGQRNKEISENSDLYKTICKWCAMQKISIDSSAVLTRMYDDIPDGLPF